MSKIPTSSSPVNRRARRTFKPRANSVHTNGFAPEDYALGRCDQPDGSAASVEDSSVVADRCRRKQTRADVEWYGSEAAAMVSPRAPGSGMWIPRWVTRSVKNPHEAWLLAYLLYRFDERSTSSPGVRNRKRTNKEYFILAHRRRRARVTCFARRDDWNPD